MTTEREKQLKSIVNASGFAFQLALENKIKETRNEHGWEVMAREHPWHDNNNGEEGFIDLILKNNNVRLVIECKRPRDAVWVFLNPNNRRDAVINARLFWSIFSDMKISIGVDTRTGQKNTIYREISTWSDFAITEESPESQFCMIRGQKEDDKTMLERISQPIN